MTHSFRYPYPDDDLVDITGLNPALVLAELYNNSMQHILNLIPISLPKMSVKEARQFLTQNNPNEEEVYFDYLKARVMKLSIGLRSKQINVRLYNRDNGPGAAQNVILDIRTRPEAK